MILTQLPDLPPRPETAANAQFRRAFYQRWGRENCLISGHARHAVYASLRQTLSIKCVARGTESYFLDKRRLTVSDDNWLLLNEGRTYGSVLDTPGEAYSFAIFFRPGMAAEIAGDAARPLEAALDDAQSRPAGIEFEECLRPHDSRITPVLRYIQLHVSRGLRDEQWLEEQCQFLLERLIGAHHQRPRCAAELAAQRAAPRAEIARRLALAVDFMHEHLGETIGLAEIAAAARLSQFHFLRLFRGAYRQTPGAYLRGLRTRRARALIDSTRLPAEAIAARVGLSRVALWRALTSAHGASARVLRQREAAEAPSGFLACD